MKMTFAMSRSCAPNSKIIELSSMMNRLEKLKEDKSKGEIPQDRNGSLLKLLRQMKNNGSEFSLKPDALQSQQQTNKTKREEVIDQKIEKLLQHYKKKDEEASMRAKNFDADRAMNRRNMLERYGYSDDEDMN